MRLIIFMIYGLILNTPHISAQEVLDASILYNDALAAYEKGDMGTAVYNLEMASLIAPMDQEIANNLQVAKSKVAIDVVEIKPFFLAKWTDAIAGMASPGSWKMITLLLTVLLLGLIYLTKIKGLKSVWTSIGMKTVLVLLILVAMYSGSNRDQMLNGGKYAIVMSEESALRLGPDAVSESVKDLSAGVKLEILDQSGEWFKTSAMDREQGWIPKKDVKLLKIGS